MKEISVHRTFIGVVIACFLAGQFSVSSYAATATSQSDPYAEARQIDSHGKHITNALLAVSAVLLVVAILMPSGKKANGKATKDIWLDDSAKNFTSSHLDLPKRKVAGNSVKVRHEMRNGVCIRGKPLMPYPFKLDVCG